MASLFWSHWWIGPHFLSRSQSHPQTNPRINDFVQRGAQLERFFFEGTQKRLPWGSHKTAQTQKTDCHQEGQQRVEKVGNTEKLVQPGRLTERSEWMTQLRAIKNLEWKMPKSVSYYWPHGGTGHRPNWKLKIWRGERETFPVFIASGPRGIPWGVGSSYIRPYIETDFNKARETFSIFEKSPGNICWHFFGCQMNEWPCWNPFCCLCKPRS